MAGGSVVSSVVYKSWSDGGDDDDDDAGDV